MDRERQKMAEGLGNAPSDETEGKYLTFWTDGQLFGVPIADVVQIVGMQTITAIPEFPPYAKGIINLRGTIIPVVDVRLRLGRQGAAYGDRTCIIVANIHQSDFGFIVDEVDEVTDFPEERLSPPPQVSEDVVNRYLTGVARLETPDDEKIVLAIDLARLLGEQEYDVLAQAAQ